MQLPVNTFKHALKAGQQQVGCWVSIPSSYTAEILAGAGFDWLLFDTEHTPADVETVLGQLQAAAAYPVSSAVRVAWNDHVLIKRFLDIGAQTLLLPYVQNAQEARAAVSAMRYGPNGVRGMGGTMRATRFGRVADYVKNVEKELCLLVQVETAEALQNIEEIAAVDGVDGLFIGPADLSASMGYPGQLAHPKVQEAIEDAIRRIRASGKAAGILTLDEALARRYMDVGTLFTAVGLDAAILARGADQLAARMRSA